MTRILIDKQPFDFSITFSKLRDLKNCDETHYNDFFECYAVKEKDYTDKALLIYVAYLCANLHKEDVLSEDEFYSLLEENISYINAIYSRIYYSKINCDFAEAFTKRTRDYNDKIKLPAFTLCDLEDYYSYFVLSSGIPENTFWNEEIPFVEAVTVNKNAVDGFLNYQRHKLLNKN